jgi:hypothetical protein
VDEVLRTSSLGGLSTSEVEPGRSVSAWEGAFSIRPHLTSLLSQLQRKRRETTMADGSPRFDVWLTR